MFSLSALRDTSAFNVAPAAVEAVRHSAAVLFGYTLLFALFFSPVLFSEHLLAPGDGITYFLPNFYSSSGFWDHSIWGGFPAIADAPRMLWYPPALLLSLVPRTWNLFVLSAYVLAASFTYGYVYALTRSKLAAFAGGCIYGLCGFMTAHLGHVALIHAAAWLPLCLWSFEMLRRRASSTPFVVGALGVACAALAGHPQIFVYTLCLCAAAVLFGGRDAGAGRWHYYLLAGLLTILGVGLAALQLVPTAELAGQSLRASLSFAEFNSYSLPRRQLPMLVFPLLYGGSPGSFYSVAYFGKWGSEDGGWGAGELTGYVGLLPLMLAAIGVVAYRRRAPVPFWLGVALVTLLLTLGEVTPLASLTYQLPVLNKFRVPARHFVEMSLAVSVLAGLGVGAIRERTASEQLIKRTLIIASGLTLACLLVVRLLLAGQINTWAIKELGHTVSLAPWANPAVGVPLLVLMVSCAALFYWSRRPDSAPRAALLVAVLVCDLASLGWFFEWHYAAPYDAYAQAPVAAEQLRGPLAATHQRIIPVRGGLGRVSELPPNLSKLWGFESASGYGPFILSRVSQLLTMPPHGSLGGTWRDPADQSLDLVGARYVLVPQSEADAPTITDERGAKWAAEDLGASVGRGCGTPHPDVFKIELPTPIVATSVGVVSALACSEGLGDQSEVARVTVTSADGQAQTLNFRAGVESSEWAYDCADVRPLMQQGRAEIFRSYPATRGTIKCESHDYVARLPLSAATQVKSIEVRWKGASGSLALKKINLFDERSGQTSPISPYAASLSDPSRWRHVADISFANSGYGREVRPEAVGASRIYENLRARPRAWLVPEVLTLDAEAALNAIRSSRLPAGHVFNSAQTALVEEPLEFTSDQVDPQARARIVRLTDGVMEVQTLSRTPAFLVTSDVYYPGWRVTIDGAPARLFRADYVLRGVPVPAGEHLVRFAFAPRSFYLGAAISFASLLILAAAAVWLRRQTLNHERAAQIPAARPTPPAYRAR